MHPIQHVNDVQSWLVITDCDCVLKAFSHWPVYTVMHDWLSYVIMSLTVCSCSSSLETAAVNTFFGDKSDLCYNLKRIKEICMCGLEDLYNHWCYRYILSVNFVSRYGTCMHDAPTLPACLSASEKCCFNSIFSFRILEVDPSQALWFGQGSGPALRCFNRDYVFERLRREDPVSGKKKKRQHASLKYFPRPWNHLRI